MYSVTEMLEQAVRHHQTGDLRQAEVLYRQILQVDPGHVHVLHLFGVMAYQVGNNALAVDFIRRAIGVYPEFAEAHSNLGLALLAQGKLAEAVASFQQAVLLKPDFAGAYNNLASALNDQGKLADAVACYRQAVHLNPDFAEAHSNLGNALKEQGKLDEAIASYRQALYLRPDYAEAFSNLGNALRDQEKLDDAIASYRQALRLKPDYAEAYLNLGNAQGDQGKFDEAIASYRQAMFLKPNYAEAYQNLGKALRDQGKPDEAIANLQLALRLKPEYVEAHNNLGNALRDRDQFEEAIASYRQALRLKPDYADAYSNMGNALRDQGKLDEAIGSYRQAVRLKPDFAQAHGNLATLLLLTGDYSEGWREYEWRWQTKHMKAGLRRCSQPLWEGNSLPHGAILLHAEQGLGDTIQFIRLAALVKKRVGTVFCECPPSLARLLRTCAGIDRIIPPGEPLPPYDVHAPLMSLPRILNITLETIPASIPYLQPIADCGLRTADSNAGPVSFNPQSAIHNPQFSIGIVWQGNPKTWDVDLKRSDQRRSIPLMQFEPLARVPGVRLISLQKGFGTEQIEELAGRFYIADLGSTCDDFSDTAAVMKNLDLVISADSSPAHLAGALGVPVWVALPTSCCWRWLTDREGSPWYPTMRLFRQTEPGDWSDVFERMGRALVDLLTAAPSKTTSRDR